MKLQQILFSIQRYLTISKKLANGKNWSYSNVFFKMILCRLVFGHNASYYALYGLDEKHISQCSEYLTKKAMVSLQKKLSPSPDTKVVWNKLMFYEKCISTNIPTPDICAILPAIDIHVPYEIPVIEDKESLSAFLSQHKNDMLFFKTIGGGLGVGALSVKLKNGEVYNHLGKKMSPEEIFTHCSGYKHGFLIQKHLAPHKDVQSLMPGPALGTFRLITFLQNDIHDVNIPYALMKIPIGGNIVDNFQHGESGNLLCGVDVASGRILNAWGKRKVELTLSPIERHPETHLVFRDVPVPYWNEIIALTTQAAKAFPELKTLGWDVAITEKGLYILEANSRYDIDLNQVTLNRGIKSDLPHFLTT